MTISIKKIIGGRICRHAVTSLVTPSLLNSFSWMIYILSFNTWCQIEAILKIAKFSKVTNIWGPGEFFRHNNHRKLDMLSRYPVQFPIFWAFDWRSSSQIELLQFQCLTYFLTWRPSYLTFGLEKPHGSVWYQTTYVDLVWWWLVRKCDLYRGICANLIWTWI